MKPQKMKTAPKDGSEILIWNGTYWDIGSWYKRCETDLNRGAWLDRSLYEIKAKYWVVLPDDIDKDAQND